MAGKNGRPGRRFRVIAPYLKWLGNLRYAEHGEVVDDLPPESIGWLVRRGLIEEIVPEEGVGDEVDGGGGEE